MIEREPASPTLRRLAVVVPVIAAVIAVAQMITASTTELSPWRGAGFGMFSTVDAHHQRFLRVSVTDERGTPIPMDVEDLAAHERLDGPVGNVLGWPTDGHLERLAAELLQVRLVVEDGVARPASAYTPPLDPGVRVIPLLTGGEVGIEVYAIRFDADTGVVTPRRIASATVRP